MNLPTISIVIPTLNSASTLDDCLGSILMQDYPRERLEIIIVDAGSTDGTLDLVRSKLSSITYRVLPNPLRSGEAGKAVGIKCTRNEIIALIDSDNILSQTDWLQCMIEPFEDKDIAASEPLYYTYRRTDPYITRYSALIGMNDPLCLFLGNYDRYSILTGKWTEVTYKAEDKNNYLRIEFPDPNRLPTIGANGFLIRGKTLQQCLVGDYFFDIDMITNLSASGFSKIAKVKIGIIHLYCSNMSQFIKKQKRRIKDYIYYSSKGFRKYPWSKTKKFGVFKFCLYTILVIPLIIQTFSGFLKKKDNAWFLHPIACWLTLLVYGYNTLKSKLLSVSAESRDRWGYPAKKE